MGGGERERGGLFEAAAAPSLSLPTPKMAQRNLCYRHVGQAFSEFVPNPMWPTEKLHGSLHHVSAMVIHMPVPCFTFTAIAFLAGERCVAMCPACRGHGCHSLFASAPDHMDFRPVGRSKI